MKDPYKILNISRDADEEEIKRAYRNLVKKYHPDRYQNSPLAEEASEKMKEINQAYDLIMKERHGKIPAVTYDSEDNAQNEKNYYYENASYDYTGNVMYRQVRMLIKNSQFSDAERILSQVPPTARTAEWYYLMGVISYNNGWLEESNNYVETACRMDRDNAEYRAFYERLSKQRRGEYGGYSPNVGCSCCDIVGCMICSDCCCNSCFR